VEGCDGQDEARAGTNGDCRSHEHAELSAPPRGACGASALGRSQQPEVPAAWLVTLLRSATSICAGAT
jgi:hypothetical protein